MTISTVVDGAGIFQLARNTPTTTNVTTALERMTNNFLFIRESLSLAWVGAKRLRHTRFSMLQ